MKVKKQQYFWINLSTKYPRVLEPIDRFTEFIYGVIMALTITCSMGIASAGKMETKTMLWAVIGCNVAWGFIDGLMLMMNTLFERGIDINILKSVQKASSPEAAISIIKKNLPDIIQPVVKQQSLDGIRTDMLQLPEPPAKAYVTLPDIRNACIVFGFSVISTFPIVIPFLLVDNMVTALRLSNAIGIVLLFIDGTILGSKTGYNRWIMGMFFSALGMLLVFVTILLGG